MFLIQATVKRAGLRKLFDNQGIEIRVGWNPLHRMKHLSGFPKFLNGTSEMLFREVFCLPSTKVSQKVIDFWTSVGQGRVTNNFEIG